MLFKNQKYIINFLFIILKRCVCKKYITTCFKFELQQINKIGFGVISWYALSSEVIS